MRNKKIRSITTCLCLFLVSMMLISCGDKISDTGEGEPTTKDTVQVKEISDYDNDGEKVESTLPKILYETKDKLVFYTTQGVFSYNIIKKNVSDGFAIMDSEYAEDGEYVGKIPLNFQGDITFVADNEATKINELYKKTINDEEEIDKLVKKQESGWTSGNGEANIESYKYKSHSTGKVYKPFAKQR